MITDGRVELCIGAAHAVVARAHPADRVLVKDWQARVVPEEKVGAGVYNAPIGFADATATAARFAVVTDPAHFVYNIGAHACAGVPQKCSDLQVMAASFQERLLVAWEAGGPPPLREAQFVHSLAATPESRAGLVREAGGTVPKPVLSSTSKVCVVQ